VAAGPGPSGTKQVLPYPPSLAKVAADDVISSKVFPYYGTNLGALFDGASGNIVLSVGSVG